MLTRALLERLCPRPKGHDKAGIWEGYVDALLSPEGLALLEKYHINSKLRLAHLMAQWAHESGGFCLVWESGTYSAKRILEIFGIGRHSARVTEREARALAHNGVALFERVYGLGNPRKARELGNKEPGDGWRYRGCGIVQLTGRAAHEKYAAKIGCDVADLAKPINNIHGALLEWKEKACNGLADEDDLVSVTRKVNGGLNGLNGRRAYLTKAKRLLESVDLEKDADAPAPELPPSPSSVSVKDLAPVSAKVRALTRVSAVLHSIWMSLLGLIGVEQIGFANEVIADVKLMATNLAAPAAFVAVVCALLLLRYLINKIVRDYQEGRYIPSGLQ